MHEFNYVLGFVFAKNEVLLIRKPAGTMHAGKWNGPGGHIEVSDSNPVSAMAREWEEETGLRQPVWHPVCRMTFDNTDSVVHVFVGQTDDFHPLFASADPSLSCGLFTPSELVNHEHDFAPHVGWLIAMCRGRITAPVEVEGINIDFGDSDQQTLLTSAQNEVFSLRRQLDGHQYGCVDPLAIYYMTAGARFRVVLKKDIPALLIEQQTKDGLGKDTWVRVDSSGAAACAFSVVSKCLREHLPVRFVDGVYTIDVGIVKV